MSFVLELAGCRAEPMAGYLKALAVFRLVSEQSDPEARGWWRENTFCMESRLDEGQLTHFFLKEYRPTPIVAPWNGGSGFAEGDRREGLDTILGTSDTRFKDYQQTINEIFSWPEFAAGEMTVGAMLDDLRATAASKSGKAQSDILKLIGEFEAAAGPNHSVLCGLTAEQVKEVAERAYNAVKKLRTAAKKNRRAGGKDEVVRLCRNRLPDRAQDWVDAAVVLRTTSDLAYPPILGTGGLEGRLDYTNSFMERVSSLLLCNLASASLLANALFGRPTTYLEIASTGQLDPGCAGGFNQGTGVETKDFPTNPWSFVLTMEGAVAWTGSATRRHGSVRHGAASSPFTVYSRAVGYGSAEPTDEDKARAEVWMPIWTRRCPFEELRYLLREGRVEWNGRPVKDAMEFTRAATSLGTDRGIASFQRFSLIRRRGDSYIALPLGRIPVSDHTDATLLRDLEVLLENYDRFARGFPKGGPPARLASARRQVDSAVYDYALKGDRIRLALVFVAIGALERALTYRDHRANPKLSTPLGGLSPRWLLEADDESLEFRTSVAIASIHRTGEVGPMRANLIPVDPVKPGAWASGEGQAAWTGLTIWNRLHSTLKRRLMDGARLACDRLPLQALLSIHPFDAAAVVTAPLDEDRLENLLFAATLVDFAHEEFTAVRDELNARWRSLPMAMPIPRDYALLKHLFDPSVPVRPEPSILSLLAANKISDACDVASRRLKATQLTPVEVGYPDHGGGVRLAAALLIPIYPMAELSRRVLKLKDSATAEKGN
ncbi:MAG: type I-U CRISPR-associated protein Csx17 [Bryobacteraceae bacterium]